MKQAGPIVAALLAGAALIWVVASTMPEEAPPPRSAPQQGDAAKAIGQAPSQADQPAVGAVGEAAHPAAPNAPSAQAPGAPPPQAPSGLGIPGRSPSGPLQERIDEFESEPRDSAAPEFEKHITQFFRNDTVPPELLDSVLCRETICRIRSRWTSERAEPLLGALMRMVMRSDGAYPSDHLYTDILVDREADADPNSVVMVDVYVRRRDPAQAEAERKQAEAEAEAQRKQSAEVEQPPH